MLSPRVRSALPSTLLAVGSLAVLLTSGAGIVDLITLLDGIPMPVRVTATATAIGLSTWRTVTHLVRLGRLDPAAADHGVAQVRSLALALRAALLGGSSAALLSGFVQDSEFLVGLALVVGLEELYETTMVLGLLELAARGEQGALDVPEWRLPEAGRR